MPTGAGLCCTAERGREGGWVDNRQAANSITSSLQQQVPNAMQPGGTE